VIPEAVNKIRLTPRETMGVVMVLLERNLKLMTRFSVSTFMFYIGVFSDAAISAFLGKTLIGGANTAQIGGDYVSYVIIGLAYSQLMQTSISAPLQSLSGAYWSSRLEPLLRAPVPLRTVVLADCLWYYLNDLVTIGVYVLVGAIFGMQVAGGSALVAGLGALILGCISVLGFGFLSASMFNLINAKGHSEPVEWLVRTLQRLVCGVYFPITVLPGWLRGLGSLMPQTYVLDCVRRLLMPSYPRGHTLPVHGTLPMSPQVINLFAIVSLTALILPLGFWAFKKGLDKARNDGGLSRWN
jgi:ABC-2 type transport system permease protein